jgi:hypothetical protein
MVAMKKLNVLFVTFLAISGFAFADSNTVASANVLGYTKITDPASNKLALVAAPFNCGTGTVSTLCDVFGTNQLRQSTSLIRCDQVILWNVVEQKYVRYAQKSTGLFYSSTNFGSSAPSVNPSVTRGEAMWIQSPITAYSPTSRTVIISGNVPSDGSYTNPIVGNSGAPLSFIANPYPVEVDINNLINTNDGAKGNASLLKADKIKLWSDANQQYVQLALKLSSTVPAVNNKWLYQTNFGSSVTSAPSIMIKPGQGFWYQTTNAFTWVETKTYTLE